MARHIAAIVAHDETVSPDLIGAHIPEGNGIELVSVVDSMLLTADDVRRADADVLIIACREQSEDGLRLTAWWHDTRPGRPVVVLSPDTDYDFVQRVFAAGADDLVPLSAGPVVPESIRHEVEFSIRKAVARNRVGAERAPDAGTLIAILGPKGGTGKTVTSTNLAMALARRGRRTVVVDLDLQFGDVTLALGLTPDVTVYDLATAGGSLDAEKLDDFLLRHPSGLRVLAAPVRPDQAASVKPEFMLDVYDLLRREYDFVVVDTPPAFEPEVIATIDVATAAAIVGMLDALSLKNARLGLETLDLMGFPQDKVSVVLNRSDSSIGLTFNDAVTILGRAPDVLVPSDRSVPRSLSDGVPMVLAQEKSDVSKAFQSLAASYVHSPDEVIVAESEPQHKPRRRLFSRARPVPAADVLSNER